MITVFIDSSYKNHYKSSNTIINIEVNFNRYMKSILTNLDEIDYHFMRNIDSLRNVHKINGKLVLESPYGLMGLNNLSTGCKTCLLAHHLKGKLISLNQCGENAIFELFSVMEQYGTTNSFLLEHSEFTPRTDCNIVFKINGVNKGNLFDLWNTIAREAHINV